MTHGYPYGFPRPAAQGSWNLRVFPLLPEGRCVVRASEAPVVVVPGV